MPVSVPAGGISIRPVTPRSAIVCMHRSQRTGLPTWPTSRRSTSWPSWTTCPSRLEISAGTRVVGRHRPGEAAPARRPRGPCARCGTRRPPTAASAGPSPARRPRMRPSCSMVPAATIWPGAVVVGRGEAVLLERGQHLVAVAAEHGGHAGRGARAASAIALPRSRTSTMACSAEMTPHAGGSGDLTDAVARRRAHHAERVGRVREQRRAAATRPDATSSGWATAVSRIVSCVGLGAVVGRGRDRRRPTASRCRSAKTGSSIHGDRNPGVWAPCPGATMTSTRPACPVTTRPTPRIAADEVDPAGFGGPYKSGAVSRSGLRGSQPPSVRATPQRVGVARVRAATGRSPPRSAAAGNGRCSACTNSERALPSIDAPCSR